jgi:hypothetical protein
MSLVNKAENKAKRGGSLEGVLGKPHTTRPPKPRVRAKSKRVRATCSERDKR